VVEAEREGRGGEGRRRRGREEEEEEEEENLVGAGVSLGVNFEMLDNPFYHWH